MQTASLNKDASTKTPILNVQIAKRQQLHQTPIDKYGGGGARAAWRIRIRRPRLAERGRRRVEPSLRLLQTPKPLPDPALPADPARKLLASRLLPTLRPQISDF